MNKYKSSISLMLLIALLQGMVFYSPVATLYRNAAGISLTQMGVLDAISTILAICLELPLGVLTARLGYKKMMILCNIVFLASKIVFWRADSLSGFLLERIMLSFVFAGLSGCDTAYLYLCAGDKDAHHTLSKWDACTMGGMIFAGFAHSLFIRDNYRLAGFLTVLTYIIALGLSFFVKAMPMRHEDSVSVKMQMQALAAHYKKNPRFSLFLISFALLTTVENTIVVFLSQLLYMRSGVNIAALGVLAVVASIAGLSGAMSDEAVRTLRPQRFTGTVFVVSALAAAVLALPLPALPTAMMIIALRISMSLYRPYNTYKLNEMATGASRAVLLSGFSMQQGIATAIAEMGLSAVADISLQGALCLCACLLILALMLNKYSQRTKKV